LGLERYVGLGRETTFAEAANATRYIESQALLLPDQGWIVPSPICDSSRSRFNLGAFRTRGSFGPFEVTADNIGEIINAIMSGELYECEVYGDPVVSGRRNWKCSNLLDSYTLHIGAEIEERILAGMLANKLQFKASHGEALQATVEWVGPGTNETTDTLASLTRDNLTSLQPFVYHHASGLISIGDSEKSANIFDFEIEIDNKIPFQRGTMASRFMAKKRYGSRTVQGKLSAYFNDDDEYDRFIAGEPFTLDLTFRGPLIGQGRYYELRFLLNQCIYLKDIGHPVLKRDEPLVIDCPFQGLYDSTYTELFIELENTEFTNPISNPDFEDDLDGWSKTGGNPEGQSEQYSEDYYHGTHSLRLAINEGETVGQTFGSYFPVSQIRQFYFFSKCDVALLLNVDIIYTDDSTTDINFGPLAADWTEYDIRPYLEAGKTVKGIKFYCSGTAYILVDYINMYCLGYP
jgi:hypothetical protein